MYLYLAYVAHGLLCVCLAIAKYTSAHPQQPIPLWAALVCGAIGAHCVMWATNIISIILQDMLCGLLTPRATLMAQRIAGTWTNTLFVYNPRP